MAAMKPRTGDGPMEVTKEARSLVMRIPLEGGGRLVVELNSEEANNLSAALHAAVAVVFFERSCCVLCRLFRHQEDRSFGDVDGMFVRVADVKPNFV